jgi:hypothetical protein
MVVLSALITVLNKYAPINTTDFTKAYINDKEFWDTWEDYCNKKLDKLEKNISKKNEGNINISDDDTKLPTLCPSEQKKLKIFVNQYIFNKPNAINDSDKWNMSVMLQNDYIDYILKNNKADVANTSNQKKETDVGASPVSEKSCTTKEKTWEIMFDNSFIVLLIIIFAITTIYLVALIIYGLYVILLEKAPINDPHYIKDDTTRISGLFYHYISRFLFSIPPIPYIMFGLWLASLLILLFLYIIWVMLFAIQPILLTMKWFQDMKNYGVIDFFDGMRALFGINTSSSNKAIAAGSTTYNFITPFFSRFLGAAFPDSQIDDEYINSFTALSDPNLSPEERQKHLDVIKCRMPSKSETTSLGEQISETEKKECTAELNAKIQNCINKNKIEISEDANTSQKLLISWKNFLIEQDCQHPDVANGYKTIGKKIGDINSNLRTLITKQFSIMQSDINANIEKKESSPSNVPSSVPSSTQTATPSNISKSIVPTSIPSVSNATQQQKQTNIVISPSGTTIVSKLDAKDASSTQNMSGTTGNPKMDESLQIAKRITESISCFA